MRLFPVHALALLLLASPVLAEVHVVAANGSGDFLDLQPAVDAAAPADTLLVKAGNYHGFLVNQKGLSIVADAGAVVNVDGAIRVRKLLAGSVVVLSGLRATGEANAGNLSYGLYLTNNAGAVRVDSCTLTGANFVSFSHNDGFDGVRCEGSSDVVFSRCILRGGIGGAGWFGDPNQPVGTGGRGLDARASQVTLWDSTSDGGAGQGFSTDAGHGGQGLRASNSSVVFASGSGIHGGSGGSGACGVCYGGDGGHGLVTETNSQAYLLATQVQGGFQGFGGFGLSGSPGAMQVGTGIQQLPGAARHLGAPNVGREGTSITLTLGGAPGDAVKLLVGPVPGAQLKLSWLGVLSLVDPFQVLELGTLSGSTLTASYPLGILPSGVDARVRYLQPLFIDTAGQRRLGPVLSLTILDASF